MSGAENGPVNIGHIQLFPNHGQAQEELFRLHLTQHFLTKYLGYSFHLSRNGSIVSRQIVMAAAGIDHDQRISLLGKVVIHRLDLRVFVLEIDICQTAGAAGHLIQQSAGLAEIHVLRKLGNLGPVLVLQRTVIVKFIKNRAQHDFKSRRAAQTAAAAYGRGNGRVKAADLIAFLAQLIGHAANQRRSGILFFFTGRQIIQRNGNSRISLAVNIDHPVLPGRNGGDRIQIDSGRQHLPAVMIGVVAGNLRASGRADHIYRAVGIEQILVALEQGGVAGGLGHHHALPLPIKGVEALHDLRGFQLSNHLCVLAHILSHPLLVFTCL